MGLKHGKISHIRYLGTIVEVGIIRIDETQGVMDNLFFDHRMFMSLIYDMPQSSPRGPWGLIGKFVYYNDKIIEFIEEG